MHLLRNKLFKIFDFDFSKSLISCQVGPFDCQFLYFIARSMLLRKGATKKKAVSEEDIEALDQVNFQSIFVIRLILS